jgi:hypothetical protein
MHWPLYLWSGRILKAGKDTQATPIIIGTVLCLTNRWRQTYRLFAAYYTVGPKTCHLANIANSIYYSQLKSQPAKRKVAGVFD